jgi:hypothetical protein
MAFAVSNRSLLEKLLFEKSERESRVSAVIQSKKGQQQ